jgi:signal transduction histidine kinase
MKNVLFILLCFTLFFCQAQNNDSIMKVANALPKGDTTRLLLLATNAWTYQYIDVKKALQFTKDGLEEAKKARYNKAIYKLLVTAGCIEQTNANYDNSINYFKEGVTLCKQINKPTWLSTCYNNLANTYNLKGDVQLALENYELSLSLKDKNIGAMWGDTYINIGALYYHLQDSATALKKFKIGLQDTNLDGNSSISLLSNINNLFCGNNQKDSSRKYLNKLKNIVESINDILPEQQILYYTSLLEYQIKFEPNNKDISIFNKAIALAEASNLDGRANDFYRLKMKYFDNQAQLDSAIYYGEKCIIQDKKVSDYFNLKNDCAKLASFYTSKGNSTKALEYMQLLNMANDSLYTLQSATATRNAEVKYNTKQKEEKNILLEKEKNTQSKLKNLYLLLGALTSLLIGIIAYSIFRSKIKTEKLNKEIESKSKELEKSNAFKTKILSIISHDVRAPIAGLQNLISLQNSGVLSAEKSKELDIKIENSLKNTSLALDNLLQWSLGEIKKSNTTILEIFILNDCIKEQINLLSTIIEFKNIDIILKSEAIISIDSDKNSMAIIIRNLLSNAIKFSPIQSKIIITLNQSQNNTTIAIQDFGEGMAKEKLTTLGKQFIDSMAGTANEKGVGLGHILIAENCKKIGASIAIESEIKQGTIVTITLK